MSDIDPSRAGPVPTRRPIAPAVPPSSRRLQGSTVSI